MICDECGTKMLKKSINLSLAKGLLKNVEVWKCKKCSEEIFTESQARKAELKAEAEGLLGSGLWLHRKIITTGNSLSVTIPSDINKLLKFRKGEEVLIGIHNNELVIKPEKRVH
jgi:YgiT-type zinc finger domain-containing protein